MTICGHHIVRQSTTDFINDLCESSLGRQFERAARQVYKTDFECNTRDVKVKSYRTWPDGNQYVLQKKCNVNPGYDHLETGDRHSEKAFCNKFVYDRDLFRQAGHQLEECNNYGGSINSIRLLITSYVDFSLTKKQQDYDCCEDAVKPASHLQLSCTEDATMEHLIQV